MPTLRVVLRDLAIVAGIAWVGAVALFIWAMLFYDGRQDLDLERWADGAESGDMMPGARWATDELCGSDVPCIQAVTSETLTMYRFEYRELAQAAAAYWGEDAYLTGWIVVRFEPGALSAENRYAFEGSVGCINTWVSEDGRDC